MILCSGGSKEIVNHEDVESFVKQTGASSVMLARAAQWNCSIFKKDGLVPLDQVIVSYLKYTIDYDNVFSNTKYCIQCMLRDQQETAVGKRLLEAKTVEEIWYIIYFLIFLLTKVKLFPPLLQCYLGDGKILHQQARRTSKEINRIEDEFAKSRGSRTFDQATKDRGNLF